MDVSVIICTHNPRMDYLARVLQALKEQDLPRCEWELVLIDNASRVPVNETCDLSWHPHARCIFEAELGVGHARCRAIREAQGEIRVFLDDDNLIGANYLATAVRLLQGHPWLGAIGGQILPEYNSAFGQGSVE